MSLPLGMITCMHHLMPLLAMLIRGVTLDVVPLLHPKSGRRSPLLAHAIASMLLLLDLHSLACSRHHTCHHYVNLCAHVLPQWVVLSLLLLGLEAGVAGALRQRPYSAHAPKKLFLQRTLRHGPGVSGHRASWDAAAIDSVPATAALPGEVAARAVASAPGTWLALYPVSNVLQARLARPCVTEKTSAGQVVA